MHGSVNPISLEVFKGALTAVAEEMGAVLIRTAYSPNIKERRDLSCALFDRAGRLIAQAAHIPVHLGSMPDSVAAALERFDRFERGDVIVMNDPFLGGTHLPDITLISPTFTNSGGTDQLIGFVANRAHHADIGGMAAGSMPLATEIYQEGIIIPPLKLWKAGQPNDEALALVLRNVRTSDERRGDLSAQLAGNRTGARRLGEVADMMGLLSMESHVESLIAYAELISRRTIGRLPDGVFRFTDYLDDDGITSDPIEITATAVVKGESITVDFAGTASQTRGNVNAVEAVTKSATYYAIRCLMPIDAPVNAGTFSPIKVIAPFGTVVNALPPAGVAAGNVETSQRIVDVVLGALAQALPDLVPAASQGTMNNITAGGFDPRTGQPFAYYETIAGGMGARPGLDGLSGVQVHMTNTMNTPIEAFEYAYPMRVLQYRLRDGSGGAGATRGGDGLIREISFQASTDVTLLSERRRFAPYGLHGGDSGERGENRLVSGEGEVVLPGKTNFRARPGDRLRIATPGGGGWGRVVQDR